ncbi:glycosyltransferase family 2 protein [Rossellomorea marisflavi]|uniref:glycosyltransferase family 2 protein n=1 Tax=Rossellomorea marisflavi TaxID=189381 RepID=UPI001EE187CB|nr:glycosyltransferase family 2 protein [Rossellomorea marisflavi]UKS64985.1 glycosyltransferase [Rossellomorea marisflavi]
MKLLNLFPFTKNEDEKYFDKVPYTVYNHEALHKQAKVTVVIPVYNAEKYLVKAIDSVIVQTFGFSNITVILIDDGSDDKSRPILKKFVDLYDNIVVVLLEENTGTPAFPRNLGIHLANSTYLMFLDDDDWLDHDGIRQLYVLMEEAKTDYAVGKTIQVDSKKAKLVGRYESSRVRKRVSPYSIPHIFYHLGPTARMMRLSFLKERNIRFPEMKYAEDKQFFIDILTTVGEISTTTENIYYINRFSENVSLTRQTDVMEKMDTNIAVLKYVLDKQLPEEEEKMIVNRLVEFDSITRLFNRKHFVKSENKQEYYDKFQEVLSLFASYKRSYSIEEILIKPLNRVYLNLYLNEEYNRIAALAEWATSGEKGKIEKVEGMPYKMAELSDGTTIPIEILVKARVAEEKSSGKKAEFSIELTGHRTPEIEAVVLQNRDFVEDVFAVEGLIDQKENLLTVAFSPEDLAFLEEGKYILTLRYDDYESVMVSKDSDATYELKGKDKTYVLYQTKKGNLSLIVKQ